MDPSPPTLNDPVVPWWEREDGLFRPVAPLAPEVEFGAALVLPGSLDRIDLPDEVVVHYPLNPDIEALELEVRLDRLVLSATLGGAPYTRAIGLPDNLDMVHQRIQLRRDELRIIYPRYPQAPWRRNARRFLDWFIAALLRLRVWAEGRVRSVLSS